MSNDLSKQKQQQIKLNNGTEKKNITAYHRNNKKLSPTRTLATNINGIEKLNDDSILNANKIVKEKDNHLEETTRNTNSNVYSTVTANQEFTKTCNDSNDSNVMVECKNMPCIAKFGRDSLVVTILDPCSGSTDTKVNLNLNETIQTNKLFNSINRHENQKLQQNTAIHARASLCPCHCSCPSTSPNPSLKSRPSQNPTPSVSPIPSSSRSSKIYNYLSCKQNCSNKITPIIEETEHEVHEFNKANAISDQKSPGNVGCCLNPMKSCWPFNNNLENIEIYNTRTIIKHESVNQLPVIDAHYRAMKHQEVQTDSRNSLKYSQHDNIYMSQHGAIISCDNDNENENDNNDKDNDNKNKANRIRWLKNKKYKSSTFHNFYWLLRPFRGKYRKPKSSSKIHAVVYKTYFVKWTKPPDLDNGFGVKRYHPFSSSDLLPSILRRCRSATF